MNSPTYVSKKPSGKGYNHVTFVVKCSDGYYEFGFYGLGKNNENKKAVTIDKYSAISGEAVFAGNSSKSLQELINYARAYANLDYNVVTNNCGDFTKYMCRYAGVVYPFGATIF